MRMRTKVNRRQKTGSVENLKLNWRSHRAGRWLNKVRQDCATHKTEAAKTAARLHCLLPDCRGYVEWRQRSTFSQSSPANAESSARPTHLLVSACWHCHCHFQPSWLNVSWAGRVARRVLQTSCWLVGRLVGWRVGRLACCDCVRHNCMRLCCPLSCAIYIMGAADSTLGSPPIFTLENCQQDPAILLSPKQNWAVWHYTDTLYEELKYITLFINLLTWF